MRAWVVNLVLSAVVALTGLGLLEAASRILVPISAGAHFLDAAGNAIEINAGPLRLAPNATFRQHTADYDAWATTGPDGFRGPLPKESPRLVFVGDSFTFGQGVADDETFAARYCAAAAIACANLGRPGTGTIAQMRILADFLERTGARPAEVKLFMLAYASGLASGNDFVDTLAELETEMQGGASQPSRAPAAEPRSSSGLWQTILAQRYFLLAHSNLARIAYQQFGPWLRSTIGGATHNDRLHLGIEAEATAFFRLRELSDRYGFRYTIYVVHPMQALERGTYPETLAAVIEAAGKDVNVVDTSGALLPGPRAYYFPYDGHFNAAGAAQVAKFLLAQDAAARAP